MKRTNASSLLSLNAEVAACHEPNKNLEVFAVDKGLGLCRTVFALKANELLMMYHPFTGRKHVQLIGCANFASYSDATENLESRLKPLIASVNLESHEKIVYNNLPKNRAGHGLHRGPDPAGHRVL